LQGGTGLESTGFCPLSFAFGGHGLSRNQPVMNASCQNTMNLHHFTLKLRAAVGTAPLVAATPISGLAFALSLIVAMGFAYTASYAQTQGADTMATNKLIDAAAGLNVANRANNARAPGVVSGGGTLSVTDRPGTAAAAPTMPLQTVVETKVQNHTTNVFGNRVIGEGTSVEAVSGNTAAPAVAASNAKAMAGFEFAQFVAQSTGKTLKVFGTDLGRDGKQLGDVDPVSLPINYRVGPGDELLIHAWGQIDLNVQVQVDRAGHIFLPKIGQTMVAGLAVDELAVHLRKVVSRQYRDFELTATLGGLRQVQYYTTGFAARPGMHTVTSAASLLNAALAAGGPGLNADPRRVVVRRIGAPPLGMDMYEMLVDGNRGNDPQIKPGDVIHFEPSRGLAAVAGQVNREAIYHVRNGDSVADLLRFSGGLTTTADDTRVRIERLEKGRRVMDEIRLTAEGLSRPVRAGDLLMVLPVSQRIDNAVTLRGNVAVPLRSPWREGMRVKDLIPSAEALVRPAAVAQRNERNTLGGMTDDRRDIDIARDYPEVNWDLATIERLDPATHSVSVLNFNLGRVLFNNDVNENLLLQAGDSVIVYSRKDFEQPESKKLRLVRLEGEVLRPGVYTAEVGETLTSLIKRAGGASDQAYFFGTRFMRTSAKKLEEQRLKQATDRIEQDYLRRLARRSQNVVQTEDAINSGAEMEAVRSLIAKLRNYKAEGRVTLDFKGRAAKFDDLPNLVLEDGDSIVIPAKSSTVTITGAVVQEGSMLWKQGGDLQHYIERAGGTRNHADDGGTVVLRADGSVRSAKATSWGGFGPNPVGTDINPGDTIFVPEDTERVSKTRTLRDWTSILYQFGIGATALKILGAL
jgi:polysaccharide biosynthesis/export protein